MNLGQQPLDPVSAIASAIGSAFGVGSSALQLVTVQKQAKALIEQQKAEARAAAQQRAADMAAQIRAEQAAAGQAYTQQTYGASSSARTQQVIALVLVGGAALAIGWYLLKQSKKGA